MSNKPTWARHVSVYSINTFLTDYMAEMQVHKTWLKKDWNKGRSAEQLRPEFHLTGSKSYNGYWTYYIKPYGNKKLDLPCCINFLVSMVLPEHEEELKAAFMKQFIELSNKPVSNEFL